jgi:pimeloyl-ACP methyl ester carboxylesterase
VVSVFGLVARLSPRLAAAWGERLFFRPPRARSARIDAFVATGRAFTVRTGRRRLAAWRWGSGPAVLLVHGWGGQGGQLEALVAPLVAAGFTAVAFDAPGHGRSGRGLSSMVDFARAVRAIVEQVGPLHGAITHSLGGAAITFALHRGLHLPRAVFICPPARPTEWADEFARRFGVAPSVMGLLRVRAEKRLGVAWSDLDMPVLAAELRTELLIVHDRDDAEVAWSDGALLASAWPGARLVTTQGLGHRRILRDPEVISQAVAFVSERSAGRASLSESARLEAELYDPSRRRAPRPGA